MTTTTETSVLPDDAQQRLDDHLDAVDEVLRRYQQNRSQRTAITDELNGQVLEMLGRRVDGGQAELADVEAVLAELDPPDAYVRQSIDLAALPASFGFGDELVPKFNRVTAFGLVWIGWFVFACLVFTALLMIRMVPDINTQISGGLHLFGPVYAYETWWGTLLIIFLCIPGFLAPLITTVAGYLGITQIRQSQGRQYGLGLAATNALFFPLLAVNALILLVPGFVLIIMVRSEPGGAVPGTLMYALFLLVLLPVGFLINRLFARRFWRKIQSSM